MCVLPNNIVHQKFFLVLWFWYLVVVVATLGHQLYRLALLLLPPLRSTITMQLWAGQQSASHFQQHLLDWDMGYMLGVGREPHLPPPAVPPSSLCP